MLRGMDPVSISRLEYTVPIPPATDQTTMCAALASGAYAQLISLLPSRENSTAVIFTGMLSWSRCTGTSGGGEAASRTGWGQGGISKRRTGGARGPGSQSAKM